MDKITNIDALILAGGKSSRMNFTDKALLKYDSNRNFLEKITDELFDFENIMVSINKDQNFIIPRGVIITDKISDIGPVEGIYQGLIHCQSDSIFVTTCDMPNITKEFIDYILNFHSNDFDAIIVRDSKGKMYPLLGIYNKSSLNTIERFILDKNYRIAEIFRELNVKYIDLNYTTFDINRILQNINTLKDFKSLLTFAGNKPFICISGAKGVGKTTLIRELLMYSKEANYKVGVVKYNSEFNFNCLDENINKYNVAGAHGALIFSKNNYILLKEKTNNNFFDYLNQFKEYDFILLEDFKHEPFPKIEIIRKKTGVNPVSNPKNLLFYVTDVEDILKDSSLNSININDTFLIFNKILEITGLK